MTTIANPVHQEALQGAGGISLTIDQQKALEAFTAFLLDPKQPVFVLEGFAGTGKTTLTHTLLQRLPNLQRMARLMDQDAPHYDVQLTATTNKAAEALSQITGETVPTIHSFLGLRIQTDFRTKATNLMDSGSANKEGNLIFIDEASYIDNTLLDLITKKTKRSKIVYMGDPAQLTPVKSTGAPIFEMGYPTARLTQVVRQAAGNPITQLATQFRETVNTGEWSKFKPDQVNVIYLTREEFEQQAVNEFTRPDWKHQDSKILAWTNQRVIDYNHAVRDRVLGNPDFQVGDYALNNAYVQVGKSILKTDQLLQIREIGEPTQRHGVNGRQYCFEGYGTTFFVANSRADVRAAERKFRAAGCESDLEIMGMTEWADLRAVYASTINKAQGSTYDRVFIDLDDIKRCNSGNQMARMMYVAVSRARHQVYLTGDLV